MGEGFVRQALELELGYWGIGVLGYWAWGEGPLEKHALDWVLLSTTFPILDDSWGQMEGGVGRGQEAPPLISCSRGVGLHFWEPSFPVL